MRYQNCMCSLIVRVRVLATALIFVNHYHHLYSYSFFLLAVKQTPLKYVFVKIIFHKKLFICLFIHLFIHLSIYLINFRSTGSTPIYLVSYLVS